jgi:hypothetical protein
VSQHRPRDASSCVTESSTLDLRIPWEGRPRGDARRRTLCRHAVPSGLRWCSTMSLDDDSPFADGQEQDATSRSGPRSAMTQSSFGSTG